MERKRISVVVAVAHQLDCDHDYQMFHVKKENLTIVLDAVGVAAAWNAEKLQDVEVVEGEIDEGGEDQESHGYYHEKHLVAVAIVIFAAMRTMMDGVHDDELVDYQEDGVHVHLHVHGDDQDQHSQ